MTEISLGAAREAALPLVSVLFITYKRFDLLQMSLESFRKNTGYPRLEIVIADDGSGNEIQSKIRAMGADVYALSDKNRGMGANNNNGLHSCRGKYILMIQDDWECCGPPDYLLKTIQVMEANPEIGLINYCGGPNLIDPDRVVNGSTEYCVLSKSAGEARNTFIRYSDQPHVVSRVATDFIGEYVEDRRLHEGEVEEEYHRRWRDQIRFVSAVFPAYYMTTFLNRGIDRSFRESRFRHRLDRKLMPIADYLRRHSTLFRIGKGIVRGSVKFLVKARVVR